MDLAPYIDDLRRDLEVAAEAGGEDARALAERLTAPLESAARLALLDALSAAAAEITQDLAPGSVEVRLHGRDPDFVVSPPPADRFLEAADTDFEAALSGAETGVRLSATSIPPDLDDGGTTRITLRVPEVLKPRIDEAAGREGLSVNVWLVRAVAAALEPDQRGRRGAGRGDPQNGRRYTGWVR